MIRSEREAVISSLGLLGWCVGDEHCFSRKFSGEDVRVFAAISGDDNPLHLDQDYASHTRFGKQLVHGVLVLGVISAAANQMGRGEMTAILLKAKADFIKPVYLDDTVTAKLKVISVDLRRRRLLVSTICQNQDGTPVIIGEGTIFLDHHPHILRA